jgi:hypothetical protein
MNKQIKELAEQSGLAIPADVRSGYIYPEGMMKFAELIIRECAEFVDSAIEYDDEQHVCINHALGEDLLNHFGVEE